FYADLEQAPEFRTPLAWAGVEPAAFDGLVLPGGHAPGMRQYLGSPVVQETARGLWELERPVGAICHGVLVLARAGLLSGRRTTGFPKYLERIARTGLVWLGDYIRTYPTYVEDEVRASGARFDRGPLVLGRGNPYVVVDGNYVSGRWFGDAYLFARTFE